MSHNCANGFNRPAAWQVDQRSALASFIRSHGHRRDDFTPRSELAPLPCLNVCVVPARSLFSVLALAFESRCRRVHECIVTRTGTTLYHEMLCPRISNVHEDMRAEMSRGSVIKRTCPLQCGGASRSVKDPSQGLCTSCHVFTASATGKGPAEKNQKKTDILNVAEVSRDET